MYLAKFYNFMYFACNFWSGLKFRCYLILQGRNTQAKDSADVADLAAQTLIRRYGEECESLLPSVKDLLRNHNLSAK